MRRFLRSMGLLCASVLASAGVGHAQGLRKVALTSPNLGSGTQFGASVSAAGDVDGDGKADVIVGAPDENPGGSPFGAGRAYVFSGQRVTLLFELKSPNEQFDGLFGGSVAGAGDVNNDGVPDVIVGAFKEHPGGSPQEAGRAYVFSGSDGSLLFELVSPNEQQGGWFGYSVSGAGDVDGDGFADAIVGALFEDGGTGLANAGRAYVFSGRDGRPLYQLVSPNEQFGGEFGISVADAGDLDGDGFPDVIVGATESPGGNPAAGRAYVFGGSDGGVLMTLVSPNSQTSGFFGTSVSGAGDVDLDGFADVIVGAFGEDSPTGVDAGRAYVLSGRDGSQILGLVSPHPQSVGQFGLSVSDAGDLNQDGYPDVLIGAAGEANDAGNAYVYSGGDGGVLLQLRSPNRQSGGRFAASVSGVGDVNQDGRADVIVGAPSEHVDGELYAGRAYLFVSKSAGLQR